MNETHLVNAVHGTDQLGDVKPGQIQGETGVENKAIVRRKKTTMIKRNGRNWCQCRSKIRNGRRSKRMFCYSLGEILLEDAKLNEERHEVPSRYVVHHKVEVVPVLHEER